MSFVTYVCFLGVQAASLAQIMSAAVDVSCDVLFCQRLLRLGSYVLD